jgi:hypothetical protein
VDEDRDLARAIQESLTSLDFPLVASQLEESIMQDKCEFDAHMRIAAVVRDPVRLRGILSRLPGVDPLDYRFNQFSASN